jgi:hypothetical protein
MRSLRVIQTPNAFCALATQRVPASAKSKVACLLPCKAVRKSRACCSMRQNDFEPKSSARSHNNFLQATAATPAAPPLHTSPLLCGTHACNSAGAISLRKKCSRLAPKKTRAEKSSKYPNDIKQNDTAREPEHARGCAFAQASVVVSRRPGRSTGPNLVRVRRQYARTLFKIMFFAHCAPPWSPKRHLRVATCSPHPHNMLCTRAEPNSSAFRSYPKSPVVQH